MVIKTIEEICENNDVVLTDTCVLSNPLDNQLQKNNIIEENTKKKITYRTKENETLLFWIDAIERYDQIFSTNKVMTEIFPETYNTKYAERIRKCKGDKDLLNLRRIIEKVNKNKRKLIRLFEENDRIIQLNTEQRNQYELFFQEYCKHIQTKSLSKTDSELILCGKVLSQEYRVCIISNDLAMVKFWSKLNASKEYFEFYLEKKNNEFRKALII